MENKKNVKNNFVWLNDRNIEDLQLRRNSKLPTKLADCGYEKLFRISDLEKLSLILSDEAVKKSIQANKSIGFKKTSCFFHLTGIDISIDVMKQLIDFQAELFDDVTLPFLPNQHAVMTYGLKYAQKKGKPLALGVDMRAGLRTINAAMTWAQNLGLFSRIKLKYTKLKTSTLHLYSAVIELSKKLEIETHVSFGNLRCNLDGNKNVASEFILKYLGVHSFCGNYKERVLGQRGFSTTTRVFNSRTWEYIDVPNSEVDADYREQRVCNLEQVENELIKMIAAIETGKLIDHISQKTVFRRALRTIGLKA